jgi:ArsR family transcriptional regulator
MEQKHLSLSKQFKALSDENRLKILCIIYDHKKVCVSDIAEKLNISVAIVSHHLHALSKVGIVTPNREGKRICYLLLKTPFAADLKRLVCKYK